jgi:hypothetical protein
MSRATKLAFLPDRRVLRHTGGSGHAVTVADAGKLDKWLATPFDALTILPRAVVGGILSLPEQLPQIQGKLEEARQVCHLTMEVSTF